MAKLRESSLVLATRNPHKVREVERLLAPAGLRVEPLPAEVELPPENGHTFEENALPKALTAAAATGRTAIADDSGIEAEALGGAPGVRSARYAGLHATDEENLHRLLTEAPPGSALRYVCALAYVDPQAGLEHIVFGECRGRRADAPRGFRGFGYDPVFVPDGEAQNRTMAELTDAEKDAISHRGNAVRALLRWLRR
ncbi:MAG: RdgB/HAM1 family non-canonical purine NTP pyrophosphatase [Solirubrobacterales bacterium]|nr:RdgB/HAM1 family non-canonical purine NTP pyrophosphatase [Solirubrobacterales bacterium]